MFEYKLDIKKLHISILTSKIFYNRIQKFNNLKLIFLLKNKSKNQVFFLFIILLLLMNKIPEISFTKTVNYNNKVKFLGYYSFIKTYNIFKFIFMHLSILDTITISYKKSNKGEAIINFKDLPVIYEVDKLCEQNNILLDYIKNYYFLINLKLSINKSFDWYYIECYIRILKLPYKNLQRC